MVREVLFTQARNPGGPALEVGRWLGCFGWNEGHQAHTPTHLSAEKLAAVMLAAHTPQCHFSFILPERYSQELIVEGCPLLTHHGLRATAEASAEAGRPLLAALRVLNLSQSAGGWPRVFVRQLGAVACGRCLRAVANSFALQPIMRSVLH